MTKTQEVLIALLADAGIDRDSLHASPDRETVVIERGEGRGRIVAGFDWSEEATVNEDGSTDWVDYTVWSEDDEPGMTDGGHPVAAVKDMVQLVVDV